MKNTLLAIGASVFAFTLTSQAAETAADAPKAAEGEKCEDKQCDEKKCEEKMEKMFAEFDKDKDGKLSLEEYKALAAPKKKDGG